LCSFLGTREVEEFWYYVKKKVFLYKERDENKRQEYLNEIQELKKEDIFYVDESGIQEHLVRERCRSPRGERVYGEKSGQKFARQNIIAAWNDGKIIAPMGYQHNCDSQLVETWVEKVLIPELTPGKVVIMDNARFHNPARLKKLIESAQCRLIFLPPYSPDLNPIERIWDWLKNKIRDIVHLFETLELAMMAAVNAK
jgi:transposase